ncbi:MAG: SGNH/GDSL hydrolase family protein [Ruminococcus sp.]
MIIRHLSIDCAYINKVLEPITQREHGVTEFEIEAKNHGADIDLSECTLAIYYGLKPDEHKVGVECRVDKDKGLIYLPLYLQMTTAEGVLKGIVELQFPKGNVRFSGVNFKVSFAPDDTKIESTDDFNILENFISKPTTDGVVGQVLSIDSDGNTIWRTLKEFDGDYAHLSNKPFINGVELNGDKSLEDLNIKQTYTADDIPFADGETFQQKFNNGELKGQDGVSGADGITPHIGDNGNWFIGETDTNKPSQGTNGVNGNDGVGITKSEVNTSGELVITYSNGDSTNLGKIVGKDGLDGTNGKDGIGIANAEINASGELTLTYSNGTSANLGKVVGADENTNNSIKELRRYLTNMGLLVFESYPYQWMYAIKDIRVTDGRAIAIGYIKRTHSKNLIALYLVENGALTTVQLYANVDSDITGYATYSNSAKTVTMAVNWDEIPYNTNVQFGKNYVLCSAWCYGDTRLNYLLDKAKEEMNLNIVNKISSFVSTGKADKIVSNVQIIGMNHTDARLLISNFNRHYNGDDTDLLYIYTTDDTGVTANLVKGVRVTEETGTATVDLSAIVSGAIMRFDYDFSGITDGTRLQGTGTGFLVKKNCYSFESVSKSDFENYEEKIPIDFGFFEKFAVVGDSYASGEIYVADSSQSKGYTVADYYQKSWGQILARKYGATCINLSVGGLTTRTWLTNSHGLAKMLAEKPQELYLCALGINDEISLGTSYLGTIENIKNYDSYSDYPDTFYGNYGKIIEQIKAHAPKSKIVLMSMAYLYNATEDSFTAAIKNIADYYNIPFINIKDDAFYAKNSIYKTGQSYNHPTAPLYAGMAQANERLFCRCAVSYYDYFKDFTGQ